ncbi:MAG: hypothetical protein R2823_08715 [Acidimicrobiia bacterium]
MQSHLDVSRETARALVVAARGGRDTGRNVQRDLGTTTTFDRAVATHKLISTGMSEHEARDTRSMNLEQVRKLIARRRRTEPVDERRVFAERYFSVQPTLDESAWTVSGRLSGVMGRIVDKAVTQKADELRLIPGAEASTRAQRQADALVAMLQDSLESDPGESDVGSSAGRWATSPCLSTPEPSMLEPMGSQRDPRL